MIQGILAVLFLGLAFNAYRTAKQRGIWSWAKFFIGVISIVAFPLLLIVPLSQPRLSQWAGNRPGIATTAILMVIFAFVGLLAYLLRKKPTKTCLTDLIPLLRPPFGRRSGRLISFVRRTYRSRFYRCPASTISHLVQTATVRSAPRDLAFAVGAVFSLAPPATEILIGLSHLVPGAKEREWKPACSAWVGERRFVRPAMALDIYHQSCMRR